MSQDVAARLAALSQDHREGRLTRGAYRSLRAPLLDMLVTAEPLASAESLATAEPADPSTTTRPRHRPPAVSAGGAATGGAGGTGVRGAGVAGAAAADAGVTGAVGAGGAVGTIAAASGEHVSLLAPEDSLVEASALARTSVQAAAMQAAAQPERSARLRPMAFGFALFAGIVALIAAWMAWPPREPAPSAAKIVLPEKAESGIHSPTPDRALTPMPPPLPSEAKRKSAAPPPITAAVVTDSTGCEPQARAVRAASASTTPTTPTALTTSTTPATPTTSATQTQTPPATQTRPCRDRLSATEFGPRMLLLAGPATNDVAFAISARPVSQAQFRMFCQRTSRPYPRQPWSEDDDPVVNVTWNEARDYLVWLSSITGKRYRLATETEWLYFVSQEKVDARWRNGNVREWLQDTANDSVSDPDGRAAHAGASDSGGADAGALDAADVASGAVEAAAGAGRDSPRIVRGVSYADAATDLLSARRARDASIRDALTGFRALREIH